MILESASKLYDVTGRKRAQAQAPNGSALWFLIAKHFRNPHSGHTDPLLNLLAF